MSALIGNCRALRLVMLMPVGLPRTSASASRFLEVCASRLGRSVRYYDVAFVILQLVLALKWREDTKASAPSYLPPFFSFFAFFT